MRFHSNQRPWAIKHPFISLYFKYQSLKFVCLPVMNSPVFPSLDDIYCTSKVALERFFEDLSNGHNFFIDQAFGLAEISKTSCPVFFFAIVIPLIENFPMTCELLVG